MPTADRRLNVYPKRLLSLTGLGAQFIEYLIGQIDEIGATIFSGACGTLDSDSVYLDSSSNDTFDVDTTDAHKGITGAGKIIDLDLITGTGVKTSVPFENTNAVDYQVGVRHQEVPYSAVEANPLTGLPNYPSYKQTYGEMNNPTSVTDNTTYIRLIINTITESGVDHSGRKVKVWMTSPVSVVSSVAFYEGTSGYTGGNNYVDIPYSGADGPLGQDTGSDPPSTAAGDYVVFIEGVTWRKNVNLLADPTNYWFIGVVTGSGSPSTPTGFDISDQKPALLISIDSAYDGILGSGSGRSVVVDSGAIALRPGASGSGDYHNALLRVFRIADTEVSGIGVESIARSHAGASFAGLETWTSGTDLQDEEPVTLASTNTINFTRSGPAPNLTAAGVNKALDLVVLHDDLGALAGLYLIQSVASGTQLLLRELDGTTPGSWGTSSGTASIVRPQLWAAGDTFATSAPAGTGDLLKGVAIGRPVTIYQPGSSDDPLSLYSSAGALGAYFDSDFSLHCPGAYLQPTAGATGEIVSINCSTGIPSGIGKALQIAGRNPSKTDLCRVWEACGREAGPHGFKDDFLYRASQWTTGIPTQLGLIYSEATYGASSNLAMEGAADLSHGGVLGISAGDTSSGGYQEIRAFNNNWYLKDNWVMLFFRFAIVTASDRVDTLRLKSESTGHEIGFYRDTAGAGGNNWRAYTDDGTTRYESGDLFTPTINTFYNFIMVMTSDTQVYYYSDGMSGAPATLDCFDVSGLSSAVAFQLQARVYASSTTTVKGLLDRWEIEDDNIMYSGAPSA